jgi:hypothetical protein
MDKTIAIQKVQKYKTKLEELGNNYDNNYDNNVKKDSYTKKFDHWYNVLTGGKPTIQYLENLQRSKLEFILHINKEFRELIKNRKILLNKKTFFRQKMLERNGGLVKQPVTYSSPALNNIMSNIEFIREYDNLVKNNEQFIKKINDIDKDIDVNLGKIIYFYNSNNNYEIYINLINESRRLINNPTQKKIIDNIILTIKKKNDRNNIDNIDINVHTIVLNSSLSPPEIKYNLTNNIKIIKIDGNTFVRMINERARANLN